MTETERYIHNDDKVAILCRTLKKETRGTVDMGSMGFEGYAQ